MSGNHTRCRHRLKECIGRGRDIGLKWSFGYLTTPGPRLSTLGLSIPSPPKTNRWRTRTHWHGDTRCCIDMRKAPRIFYSRTEKAPSLDYWQEMTISSHEPRVLFPRCQTSARRCKREKAKTRTDRTPLRLFEASVCSPIATVPYQ